MLNQDFRDLFRIFNAHNVRYLVANAYAVIYYAEPRYTKDLDIWIDCSPENADRVWRSLTRYGAPLEGVTAEDFSNPELIYQIGVEPNRIDVMMEVPGLEFSAAWQKRVTSSYGGETIFILDLNDLIHAKKTTNRESDRLDVSLLEQVKKRRRQE